MEDTDNGQSVNQIISQINVTQTLSRLNKKDRLIIKLLQDGYNQKEIMKTTKTNYPYIKRLKKRLIKLLT